MRDTVFASLFVVLAWLVCTGQAEKRCNTHVRAYVGVSGTVQQPDLQDEEIVGGLQRAVGFDLHTCESFVLDDVFGNVKFIVVGFDSLRIAERVKRVLMEQNRESCNAGVWCSPKSVTLSVFGETAWDVVSVEMDGTVRVADDDELFWAAYTAARRFGLNLIDANGTTTADGRLAAMQLFVQNRSVAHQLEQAINGLPAGRACRAGIFCHALRASLPALVAPSLAGRVVSALAVLLYAREYLFVLKP